MKAKITIFLFFAVFYTSFSVWAQPNTEQLDSTNYEVLEDQDTTGTLYSEDKAVYAENIDSIVTPKNLTITPHSFDEANWQKIIEGINYNREQPKPKPIEQPKKALDLPSLNIPGLGGALKILLWMLLIGILVTILVYLLNSNLFGPNNRKLDGGVVIDLDNIEQHLQESDLEKYLRQALEQKQYKQAIRLYYLMLIKELSAKKHIEWAKEKTNRQYLYELGTQPTLQTPFRESTRIFERVWYGESTFEEGDFEQVAPVFQGFLKKI